MSHSYTKRTQKLAVNLLLNQRQNTVLVHRRFEFERDEALPRSVKS